MHFRLITALLLVWSGTSWSSEILPNPSFEILTGKQSSRYAVEWYGEAQRDSSMIFTEPGPGNPYFASAPPEGKMVAVARNSTLLQTLRDKTDLKKLLPLRWGYNYTITAWAARPLNSALAPEAFLTLRHADQISEVSVASETRKIQDFDRWTKMSVSYTVLDPRIAGRQLIVAAGSKVDHSWVGFDDFQLEIKSRLGLMLTSSLILVLAAVGFCFRVLLFPPKKNLPRTATS